MCLHKNKDERDCKVCERLKSHHDYKKKRFSWWTIKDVPLPDYLK